MGESVSDTDSPRSSAAAHLGYWSDMEGMPAFTYTADQRKRSFAAPYVQPSSFATPTQQATCDRTRHWHQLGNDSALAIATNHGFTQMFDFTHGARWMNKYDASVGHYAGGYSYIGAQRSSPSDAATGPDPAAEGFLPSKIHLGACMSSLYLDAPPEANTRRCFGVGFYDTQVAVPLTGISPFAGLTVTRRVMSPYGTATHLLSRVTLTNTGPTLMNVALYECVAVLPWAAARVMTVCLAGNVQVLGREP